MVLLTLGLSTLRFEVLVCVERNDHHHEQAPALLDRLRDCPSFVASSSPAYAHLEPIQQYATMASTGPPPSTNPHRTHPRAAEPNPCLMSDSGPFDTYMGRKGRLTKMDTSVNPSESRASRMAPTRPSIMSEGATTSAPARAWHTTCHRHRHSHGHHMSNTIIVIINA